MNAASRKLIENVRSEDKHNPDAAFLALMKASDRRVDRAHEVWDDLAQLLTGKDHQVRAIGAQVLCNLARSDPRGRLLKDSARVLAVTRDDRVMSLRHGWGLRSRRRIE